LDVSYLTILLLERLGLAWDDVRPGHCRSTDQPEEPGVAA
jgi:hypothetical protein